MTTGGDAKDVIELFKRPLLRLRHEEKYHEEGNDVQTSVKAEDTGRSEGNEETGERHGQDRGPEVWSGV